MVLDAPGGFRTIPDLPECVSKCGVHPVLNRLITSMQLPKKLATSRAGLSRTNTEGVFGHLPPLSMPSSDENMADLNKHGTDFGSSIAAENTAYRASFGTANQPLGI
jgi:hypothetical protein